MSLKLLLQFLQRKPLWNYIHQIRRLMMKVNNYFIRFQCNIFWSVRLKYSWNYANLFIKYFPISINPSCGYFTTNINHQSDMWQQIRFHWMPLSDLPFFTAKLKSFFIHQQTYTLDPFGFCHLKYLSCLHFFGKKLTYFTWGKKVFQKELLREKKSWMNAVCHRMKHEIPPKLTFPIWLRGKQHGKSMELSPAIWIFNSHFTYIVCYVESFQIIWSTWFRCK